MKKRFDVAYNPKLRPFLEKALKNEKVKALLAYYHLKENEQGIARLSLILFLRDIGISPDDYHYKHNDNKKT